MSLLYEDKTRLLKRLFFDVQNEVGLGRQEEPYHQACKVWLADRQIPYASKPPHPIMLRDEEVYVLHPDFVVWDCITLELKAVPRRLTQAERVQLYNYLKYRQDRLGLLVNMGLDRVQDERVLYAPAQTRLIEDWRYWSGAIESKDRDIGIACRDALRFLYDAHGTGYGDEIFQRLIECALRQTGLEITCRPIAKAYYHGVEVGQSPLDCIVVEDRLLVAHTALFDNVQFSVNRGLSYMRALGLKWGIAVDFGKKNAYLTGLRNIKE